MTTGRTLHHAYLQATTVAFAGIVMCQVGTAFAARTSYAGGRSEGRRDGSPRIAGKTASTRDHSAKA